MAKKVLIIHPQDETTDFLTYIHHKDATIVRTDVGDSILRKLISSHDIIIMLGHGDSNGMYGFDRRVIDSSFVDVLRAKICFCIWCYAGDFVKKYNLNSPFSTGMFVSDFEEAQIFNLKGSLQDIEFFNMIFAKTLKMCLVRYLSDKLDKTGIIGEMKYHYRVMMEPEDHEIIAFNKSLFYSSYEGIE